MRGDTSRGGGAASKDTIVRPRGQQAGAATLAVAGYSSDHTVYVL
jgi:hypothetical protein